MTTDINQRFSALRTKLDGMNYCQPLHPDSVALVEKLFNDFMKTSTAYQNLKKTSASQSVSQVSNNTSYTSRNDETTSQYKLDLLNKQFCEVKEQLRLKEEELSLLRDPYLDQGRLKEIRDKYDNKINEFLSKVDMLESRQKQMEKKNKRLEDTITELNKELDGIKDELFTAQRSVSGQSKEKQMLRRQLDNIMDSTGSLDSRRAEEMNCILERRSARVKELEDEDVVMKSKLATLKREMECMEVDRKQLHLQNKTVNCVLESLKVENSDLNRTNSKLKTNIEDLSREIEANKKYRSSLQGQLQEMKISEFERSASHETRELAKDRLSSQCQDSAKALQAQKLQNENLVAEKSQLQNQVSRSQSKIKELSNKNLILNKNMNQLQEQLNLTSGKLSQKIKEYRQLEVQKLQLERASKQVEPTQQRYIELEAKYSQLLASGDATFDIETKGRREYEHQVRLLQQQIDVMRERQEQSVAKTEKLSNEIRRLQTYMQNGNRQIDLLNSQKESFMKDNRSLKEQLDSHLTKTHTISTQGIKQVQKINSNEILIQDLKSTLHAQTEKVRALLDEIKLLEANVRKTDSKNRELHDDNVKLKTICDSLEANKNQLWGKLKRTQSDRGDVETQKKKYSEDYLKMKSQLQLYKEELEEKERALLQIDDLRDEVQKELDGKNIENDELVARVRQLEEHLRRHDQALGQNELSLRGYESNYSVVQTQYNKLIKANQKLQVDLKSAHSTISKYQNDLGRQAGQNGLLVANNKDKSKENQRLQSSYSMLEQTVFQLRQEVDGLRTQLKISKISNDDLDQRYMAELSEKNRLENIVRQMETQNHSMFNHLHQRDQELADTGRQLGVYNVKLMQYESEITSYERQLSILTNQLNLRDEDFRRTAMQRDYLKSEVSTSRREPQIDWKNVMEERLMQTQCELQLKKRQIQNHVIQNRKLQKVIQNQRMANFKLSKQLQEGREYSQLQTPIRNLICQSLQASQIENNSIHSNRGQVEKSMESFQSKNTVNSRQIQNEYQRIKEKYYSTINGMENIKGKPA